MKASLLLIMVSMLPTGPTSNGEPLAIRVSPIVAVEPANVRVSAFVEQNDANRAIEVIVDSPNFYRSSESPLEGKRSPRITTLEFRNVPGGYIEVRVTLKDSGGRTIASARSHVTVLAGRTSDR